MVTNRHSFPNTTPEKTVHANDRILRWTSVGPRVGICRSHVHQLVAQGKFPPPIKLGTRASGWLESEINAWIEQRTIESRTNDSDAA